VVPYKTAPMASDLKPSSCMQLSLKAAVEHLKSSGFLQRPREIKA